MTPRNDPTQAIDGDTKLRVLFVVDFPYWITGAISRRIWRHNPWIEPGMISQRGLRRLLRRNHGRFPVPVDVVHFMTPYLATEFRDQFRDLAPCVVAIHHIDGPATTEPAGSADAIMTVCDQWHTALVQSGVPEAKCVMIRNAVDPAVFRPAGSSERRRLRARFGIGADDFCIGFTGKQSSDANGRKGIDTFIAAAELFAAEHPNALFVIVGPGWAEVAADFRRRAIRMLYFPFLLEAHEVADVYRVLDLYWVTSRVEGGPVPLLEAMSSGAPCLSTPVGAALEAIDSGVNGLILPHDDAAAFSKASLQLVSDRLRLVAMARAAQATPAERFPMAETVAPARQLYGVAMAAFQARTGRARAIAPRTAAWRDGEITDLPWGERRSTAAGDQLQFMETLRAAGAAGAARKVALRAVLANPLGLRTWRQVLALLATG